MKLYFITFHNRPDESFWAWSVSLFGLASMLKDTPVQSITEVPKTTPTKDSQHLDHAIL